MSPWNGHDVKSVTIVVQNESTAVTEHQFEKIVRVLKYQAVHDYNPSAWVTESEAPFILDVYGLAKGTRPPAGSWSLILMDRSDQQGALGYHDDEQGTRQPFSEIFAVDARAYGSSVSAVASHEMIEMVVDPWVEGADVRKGLRRDTGQFYIVEACDPVQGNDYDVHIAGLHGFKLSDFCLPAWWQLDGASKNGPLSFRESVSAPFELASGGYISVAPEENPNDWSQIFGSQQDRLPRWASRLPRIHGHENLRPHESAL